MSVEFKDNSIKVIAALEQASVAYLYEATNELTSQVKRNTDVDTGDTKNAWENQVDTSNLEGIVGNSKENSLWEEFGTGEWADDGKGRKSAWYIPVEKVTGNKKPAYNGKVVIVYGENGQAFYKTNGKKPKRPFLRAFNKAKPKLEKRAKSIFKEYMQ